MSNRYGVQNFNGSRLLGVAAPVNDNDVATKVWTLAQIASAVPTPRVEFVFSLSGLPPAAPSNRLFDYTATTTINFPANFANSFARCRTGPSAQVVLPIRKNGSQIATITFAAGATTGTFATTAAFSLVPNDIFELIAPATQDTNFADLSFTLVASR